MRPQSSVVQCKTSTVLCCTCWRDYYMCPKEKQLSNKLEYQLTKHEMVFSMWTYRVSCRYRLEIVGVVCWNVVMYVNVCVCLSLGFDVLSLYINVCVCPLKMRKRLYVFDSVWSKWYDCILCFPLFDCPFTFRDSGFLFMWFLDVCECKRPRLMCIGCVYGTACVRILNIHRRLFGPVCYC